jgi:SAM-dependent methyltransferase
MDGSQIDPCLRAYQSPAVHEAIASMIRRRSSNREDVREVLLRGLDLSATRDVLDLGCGFGLLAETIAGRVAADARLTGVDACAPNAAPFCRRVEAAGRRARFITARVGPGLALPAAAFDLIVCSYSLYFFPDVLPDLALLLAPRGRLLVLIHSEQSFGGLIAAAGLDPAACALMALVRRFSAENARAQLAPHFEAIERVDFPNELRFGPEDREDLFAYLRFKLPLLAPDGLGEGEAAVAGAPADGLPASMRRSIEQWLARHGELIVEKNDAGFRCQGPRTARGA